MDEFDNNHEMSLLENFLSLLKGKYLTLNLIEISRKKLLDNYQYLSGLDKSLQIAPVLKSNAYGHGIQIIGEILDQVGAPFFCVDSLYEAYELQKIKIKTPILIMGYTDPENFKVKKLPFQYAVFDLRTAETLNKYQPGAKIHIFVDTGMNREGIGLDKLDEFILAIKKLVNLRIEGIMSHLASTNDTQIKNFKLAQDIFKKNDLNPKWRHLGASSAILNPFARSKLVEVSNLVRIGLALYNSVLTLSSKLIQIKTIRKGDRVGYDGTFTATKNMQIGVLPIGYNDGVDRRLSNKGTVTIQGKVCKILGRVSMNITTINLINAPDAKIGDMAVFNIEQIAKTCNTIPYEILVHLHPSMKRIVI